MADITKGLYEVLKKQMTFMSLESTREARKNFRLRKDGLGGLQSMVHQNLFLEAEKLIKQYEKENGIV